MRIVDNKAVFGWSLLGGSFAAHTVPLPIGPAVVNIGLRVGLTPMNPLPMVGGPIVAVTAADELLPQYSSNECRGCWK